uniref:Secreted protein n=1 Tax=Oryza meridionalis TaxID=40149 RepID=A0A0E0EE95_9ORYZ
MPLPPPPPPPPLSPLLLLLLLLLLHSPFLPAQLPLILHARACGEAMAPVKVISCAVVKCGGGGGPCHPRVSAPPQGQGHAAAAALEKLMA